MIDIEVLKKSGLTFEEVQSIVQAEKDIEEGNICSHEEMKKYAKEKIFAKTMINV